MIKRLLPFTLVIAMGVGAAAQTSTASQANSVSPANRAAEPALTSNGPVTLDYKVVPTPSADPAEAAIAKKVRDQVLKLPVLLDVRRSGVQRAGPHRDFEWRRHQPSLADAARMLRRP